MENSNIWAKRLLELLEEQNKSQKDMSKEAGISQSTISAWLHSKQEPKIIGFSAAAKYLGVTMDYLFGENEGKTPENQAIHEITGLSDASIEKLKANLEKIEIGNENVSGDSEKKLAVCNYLIENMENSAFLSSLYDYLFGTAKIVNVGQDVTDNTCVVVKTSPTGKEKRYEFSKNVFANASYTNVQSDLMEMKKAANTSIAKEDLIDWVSIKKAESNKTGSDRK